MLLNTNKEYGYLDMITMSFKTSRIYSSIFLLKTIIDALLPTLSIFVTANFISTAISVYNGEADIMLAYGYAAILAIIMVYNAFISLVMDFLECKRAILYRRKLVPEIIEKHARLEYRHIENSNTKDLIERICPEFDKNVWNMYQLVLKVVNLIIYFISIMMVIFTQVWWLAIAMFIITLPIVYIATKAGQHSYETEREVTKAARRAAYLSEVLKSREAVEERTVYGFTESLNNQYSSVFDNSRKLRLKMEGTNIAKSKLGGVVTTAYSVGFMFFLLTPVVNGTVEIGMFIALMIAVFELANRLLWGINDEIRFLSEKREYLKDLTEFVGLEEHEDAIVKPAEHMSFEIIEFKNVSFTYPGTEKLILCNISFIIEKGKNYAFVGENGAGKTTIIKLITGLYTNFKGEILVDGRSIREFSMSEIKGLSSVVYQDFAKYYITLYDNIAIGDVNNPQNHKGVEDAVQLMDLSKTVAKLKKGLDTPLGKIMDDSADISGGEWQRVAMARSVISNAPLRVMDEPTASLDPISESMVYSNFEQISKGKTTLLISHRLGSTKLSDVIYVLSQGKIVESGSHFDLMTKKGTYYEMFNTQAKWYKTEDVV